MLAVQRYALITRALESENSLSVHDLMTLLGVSRETVRRDIAAMVEQGLITKVHGGIVASGVGVEPAYGERAGAYTAQKSRIAERAVQDVSSGETLFIDSGTTMLQLARRLPSGYDLQVFTNSLVIGEELVKKRITTYILGGTLRAGELSMSGSLAQDLARLIHVDRAYFGAGALSDAYGVMDYHLEEAALRRMIGDHAGEVVILADSSKYGKTGVVHVFDWSEVSRWITDEGLDDAAIEHLSTHPVEIVRV